MEETTSTTLENIQRAALTEFLDKGFLGASLRQIVKKCRGYHGSVLWLFFQQRGVIQFDCRAPCRGLDGTFYGESDDLC